MGEDTGKVTLREEAADRTAQQNTSTSGGTVDGITGAASAPGEGDGIHIARADASTENKSFRPVTETKERGRTVEETK